jgi:hypothetical protein
MKIRLLTSFLLATCLIYASLGFACSKAQLTSTAKDVLGALKDAQPFIAQLLPGKAAAFAALIPEAERLVAAVQNSDKATALALVADIGPTLSQIAADLHANANVMAILAVANIGLHFLVNHLPATVGKGASASPVMARAMQFKQEAVWGCRYRPDKCGQ